MQITSTAGYFIQYILKIKPPLTLKDEEANKVCELFEKLLIESLTSLK
ncbi:MAG: hypothetical protein ACFFCG_12300 [Promethearchaeota archaeon]